MATENVTHGADLPELGERIAIARDASYEVESIALLLRRSADCELGDEFNYLLRGLAIRLVGLSSIVMSSLGDEMESAVELRARLEGGAA